MKKIGVITNDETPVFQSKVIHGIRWFLSLRDYEIVVAQTGHPNADLSAVKLDMKAMDGFLVIANALTDDALRALYEQGEPLSLVSHQLPNSPIPAVIPDNMGGIVKLVDYLVNVQRCKSIAFIQGDLSQTDGIERTRTFQQELMRYGIEPHEELMLKGDFDRYTAAQSVRQLLDSQKFFQAIAAADYLMAIAAMDVLKERGIKVPEQAGVVGFGDAPEAHEAGLTTVGVDVEMLGVRAARQLLGQLDGLRIEGVTLMATEIVERASC